MQRGYIIDASSSGSCLSLVRVRLLFQLSSRIAAVSSSRTDYGQKKPYYPPEKARLRSTRIEYAFEPNHDSTPNAHLTSPIRPFLDLLETDAQRHKFKLLLDEYYDAKAGTITVECDRFPAFAQNLKWCSDQIDACLEEAKVCRLPSYRPAELTFSQ